MSYRRSRSRITRVTRRLCAIGLAIGATSVAAGAQAPNRAVPPLAPDSIVGAVSFDLYCASCHGHSGKGDGPVAPSLWTPPADLTTLARLNGGTFPRARVLSYVEGSTRLEAVYGMPDMPVWGEILRALEASDVRARVRLSNLVAYVESIQVNPNEPPSPGLEPNGAVLFRTFCAGCHGPRGHGDGM